MKKTIFLFSAFLLLLNGTGAIYGGLSLMLSPGGHALNMPLYFLRTSPFYDYFLPGLLLLLFNGLLSFIILLLLIRRERHASYLVIIQGVVLFCWMLGEIWMLRTFTMLQMLFTSLSLLMVYCGYWLSKH